MLNPNTSSNRYSKYFVKGLLNKDFCTIKFYKKDGTLRTARGTTNPDYLSHMPYDSTVNDYRSPDNIIKYYDVDDNHWKSFFLDRLVDITCDTQDEQPENVTSLDYLCIDGVQYTLDEVRTIISNVFNHGATEWYGLEHELVLSSFSDIINSLRKPKTIDDWKQAVNDGQTTASFDDWKQI